MPELPNAECAERMTRLRRITENMMNMSESTLQDIIDTLGLGWKSGASKLFVSRMEELREEVTKEVGNIMNRLY